MREFDAPKSGDRDRVIWKTTLLTAALILIAGAAAAQIPDKFENLEVLPKDTEKRQLVDVMKSFCAALDVRCTHCHVGEEGAPLSEVDFASDENHHKDVTRVMMRMVDAINNTHLPQTGKETAELVNVTCVTCHRGQSKPRSLEDVLSEAVVASGTEAALAKYRELRQRYYGSATFDFSAGTLIRLASQLAAAEMNPAAIAFLELNTELYPEEGMSYFFLGDLHARIGDKAKAIKNFEKAQELNPKNPIIKRKLEQLKGD